QGMDEARVCPRFRGGHRRRLRDHRHDRLRGSPRLWCDRHRLCGEAGNGQILTSPRIFSKVETRIDAEPVGDLTLKGFQRPVFTHNVLGVRVD
ncbi:MAG TPA: hypothetical protein VFV05_04960, partial [Methylomirabilota bacterium]|nr:hypothetical protein [Methylomirabilota bacterium]